MSSSNFVRLCGLAALVGGVLFLIPPLLQLAPVPESTGNILTLASVAASTGDLLGSVLMLLGLFGLYTRQSEASGALGLIGFLATFLGTAMFVGASWTDTFVTPSLLGVIPQRPDELAPIGYSVSYVTFILGWLLFGVATLRARVYPRTAVWLLLIGIIGAAAGFALWLVTIPEFMVPGFMFFLAGFHMLFAAALAYLGFVVYTREGGAPLHKILYGVLLAIVGLSPEATEERDDTGTDPHTTHDT